MPMVYFSFTGILWRAGAICHHQSAFYKQWSNTEMELELLHKRTVTPQLKSMLCRFALLTGATVLHKGIQERIAGGFAFKVN